ncbi:MAG: type IX secretion system sortase PorU [Bacteroidales bacterium]
MLRKLLSVFAGILTLWLPFSVDAQLRTQQPVTGIHTFAPSSVLADGRWVRISITETGIYQITDSDLRRMGFTDPAKVAVYGYGGNLLDESFASPHIDDLPKVAFYRDDVKKRILFYGKGLAKWNYKDGRFVHQNNFYANEACYFLRQEAETPKGMLLQKEGVAYDRAVDFFHDYALHEKDETNIGSTGREMYGESFLYTRAQTFKFGIEGVIPESSATVDLDFVYNTNDGGGALIGSIGSRQFMQSSLSNGLGKYYFANRVSGKYSWNNPADNPQVNITLKPGGNNTKLALLNYIRLNCQRKLRLYGSYTIFRNILSEQNSLRYQIDESLSGNAIQVWDVTDPENIIRQDLQQDDRSKIYFTSAVKGLREYVLLDVNASFPGINGWGEIPNQNLHALPQTDMVIIVQPKLRSQAERLAQYRREKDNLHVTIVTPQQIYNEFSSGTADATAYRRFMKMFYDRSVRLGTPPSYLLLFGDGANDNRGIESGRWKKSVLENCLLTYQSEFSLSETRSYVCDDYFGFLDDNEGGKLKDGYLSLVSDKLDLGIGRLSVRTVTEAKQVVDKIIAYSDNKVVGSWKNNLCFLGDDGDHNLHMDHAEKMVKLVQNAGNHEFVFNKIYLDSYKRENTASGTAYPDAKKIFFDQLQQGALLVNYSGHGATTSITHEKILTLSEAQNLYMKRLPVWITATCDFSRFDHHAVSAGEALLLNPNGGAAALFTTTRVVYSNGNFSINQKMIENLFAKHEDGTRYRMGDIMRLAKCAMSNYDENKLNFLLLGDPSMKMAYPEYRMEITRINDEPVSQIPFEMNALSRVTIKGRVLELGSEETATGFNGILYPTVYDCEEKLLTQDNDQTGAFTYYDRTRKLFAGMDSVRNGEFDFSFIVPRDISYSGKSGMVNLYAYESNEREAQGYFDGYVLSGTAPEIEDDTLAPIITKLYLNNDSFKDGNVVNNTPYLFAEIEDNTGVNATGASVGHDLAVTIYSDSQIPVRYVLNDYFLTLPGESSKGTLGFSIPQLPDGVYTLELKVWDVYNNSAVRSITFEVKSDLKPVIFDLRTDRNPVQDEVQFIFTHNRPESMLKAKIQVYTQMGQCVWEFEVNGRSDFLTSLPVKWDLRTGSGERILPGIYIYRASLSGDGQHYATKGKKLIVIAQ